MRIAILTFDGFNEIDSFVAFHILNRVQHPDWNVELCGPADSIASMNGVKVEPQIPLELARQSDAVVIGSGTLTRSIADDERIMGRLGLDPERQLIASQCSGVLILAKLGLLGAQPVCTDRKTATYPEATKLNIVNSAFHSEGNIATAGGCLASHYLATWLIMRLAGQQEAEAALRYVVPVGEEEGYVERAIRTVSPFVSSQPRRESMGVRKGFRSAK